MKIAGKIYSIVGILGLTTLIVCVMGLSALSE